MFLLEWGFWNAQEFRPPVTSKPKYNIVLISSASIKSGKSEQVFDMQKEVQGHLEYEGSLLQNVQKWL